ncbi:MAG TPA: hypothetical protein VMR74_08745 [Gammaproteobacteria bacterium]|nr:hypothetical protein [Gammaproteobacteria bacterium]
MKHVFSAGSLLLLLLTGFAASGQEADSVVVGSPGLELSALTGEGTWELRVYTINRGRLDDFVEAWREGVYPLRLEQGFKIPAAWVSRENNQFIWILGYDGPLSWDAAQSAYYGSSQRQDLDVDPLDFIAHGDTWPITPVN